MQAYTTKIRRGTLISDAALAADNTTTYFHGLSSISMPGMKRTTVEASSNEDLEEVERGRPRRRVSCIGKPLTVYNEPPYNPCMAIHQCSPRDGSCRELVKLQSSSFLACMTLGPSLFVRGTGQGKRNRLRTCPGPGIPLRTSTAMGVRCVNRKRLN